MTLVDPGNGNGHEFLHTDYHTGEGKFGTHSKNMRMKTVNPELSAKERKRIRIRDAHRRNDHKIYLLNKNNTQLVCDVRYNQANEDLSISTRFFASNGKRLIYIDHVGGDKR